MEKEQSRVTHLFKPALKIMNRLKYLQKFSLILALFILPAIIVTGLWMTELNEKVVVTNKQLNGLEYNGAVLDLVKYTQQHRGMAALYLGGKPSVKPQLEDLQNKIQASIEAIDKVNESYGESFGVSQTWQQVKKEWYDLQGSLYELELQTATKRHTELISNYLELNVDVADASHLNLDTEIVSHYLIEAVVHQLPWITEYMGQSRAIGSGIAAKQDMTVEENFNLLFLTQAMQKGITDTERGKNIIFTENAHIKSEIDTLSENALYASQQLVDTIRNEIIDANEITLNGEQYFEFATNTINDIYTLLEFESDLLAEILQERMDESAFHRNLVIVTIAISSFLIMYLFIAFYISIRQTISTIEYATINLANGDLTTRVKLEAKDETKAIEHSVNKMVDSFENMIMKNQQVTDEVASLSNELSVITKDTTEATNQVAKAVQDVADGAETQVQSSEDSARAMEEMAAGIGRIAESTSTVAESASIMEEKAHSGERSVKAAVEQMNHIQRGSDETTSVIELLQRDSNEIGQIIQMITDISGQTNLLALNAAIEAARAGEAGKGFAVVADEIRKLADQTSQSASKINDLITEIQKNTGSAVHSMDNSRQDVTKGIDVVNEVGAMFNDILKTIESVSEQIDDISSVSEQLSASSEEVSASVQEVAVIAKEASVNAQTVAGSSEEQLANIDEISSSANSLATMADELKELINQFKVSK